ncbi:hypothetical protein AB834_02290 [PVC group bacterium (ex Bugula neritina AB1)]|nr:hypothetical protein AB834_02290 [PVC group bacterium (ex Bugula neritina AB1)]
MTESNENNLEAPTKIGVLIHSFFVVPFIIAVMAVLLFTGVKILTSEKKTADDHLQAIRDGGRTKRWQAAFELSKIIASGKERISEESFVKEMILTFDKSIHDDKRVRDYLALAMGRSKDKRYIKPLLKALTNREDLSILSVIYSLGLLEASSAAPEIAKFAKNKDIETRLVSIIALGNMKGLIAKEALLEALTDPEPNIQWDAAIGLAKQADLRSKNLLSKMLNRDYWDRFKNVDRREQNQAMIVAINCVPLLKDKELNRQVIYLGDNDPNLEIRSAAKKAMNFST